ncbi:MAG: SGNH/GDSL hydrolase family protein [Bryobacteraceae bacterium]
MMDFIMIRQSIGLLTLTIGIVHAQPGAEQLRWRNIHDTAWEGQGWTETKHPFDRLPARAEGVVRAAVWNLQKDSAGMAGRFISNAKSFRIRWTLRKERLALPHMPATGVSGVDVYVKDNGRWHWLAAGRPEKFPGNEMTVSGLDGATRQYMVYLPLYNGVESLEIGLPEDASYAAGPARAPGAKPIVFYGTSILHGGCASRPGMAYPSIAGRLLDWPIINLGFSGNGKTEPEVSELLASLDPAVYVLDSLPNLSATETAALVPPFYRKLREAHPATPIVLVENVIYTQAEFVADRKKSYTAKNAALRAFYEKLRTAGEQNVYYVRAEELLGADGEDTVDGTHPTDLGFMRMGHSMARVLTPLLAR